MKLEVRVIPMRQQILNIVKVDQCVLVENARTKRVRKSSILIVHLMRSRFQLVIYPNLSLYFSRVTITVGFDKILSY